MSDGARQVAASSILLLAENLVRLALVAGVSFWIARQLGPGQFGILNFASALAAILLSVATMGLDGPVILRLSRNEPPAETIGALLVLRITAGVVVFFLAVFLALGLKSTDEVAFPVAVIVALSIPLSTFAVLDYWFKAQTSAIPPALARISATLIAAAAKIVCLAFGFGVVALAWTVALEALATSVAMLIAYLNDAQKSGRKIWDVRVQTILSLARECFPYLLSAVAIVAFLKADVVMLGYLSSNSETGEYSLAQKLSEVLYIVPVVLIESAYPLLTKRFFAVPNFASTNQGQMLFDLAVAGSMIATIFAVLIAEPLIFSIFGEAYRRSVEIFHLHAWSCIPIAMNTARHRWFATVGLQRFAPIVTIVGLILNVALNAVLIPMHGAIGAAIATLLSYTVAGYLTSFALQPLREIGRMQTRALWPWSRLRNSIKKKVTSYRE